MNPFRMMVLGGGSSQLHLLQRLKAQGLVVILADMNPKAPGRDFSDIFTEVSTFDIPGVLKAAKKERINGILTLGTDQPVLTAAVTAHELGLPSFISPDTALGATNKRVMKHLFLEHNIPTVPFSLIDRNFSSRDFGSLRPPLVLKPIDSQGQRGIFKLETSSLVRDYIDKTLNFSREEIALLEEYYPSKEITVSGWVIKGETHILTITDRVTIDSPLHIGICAAHRFPTMWEETHNNQIRDITRNIVKAFRIENGPIYFQMLIGEKGILVNEIACRIGGAYEDEFIPLATGVDILQMLILGSMGKSIYPEIFRELSRKQQSSFLTVVLFFAQSGKVHHYAPTVQVFKIPGMENLQYLLPNGTVVKGLENSSQRAGYLIVQGSSKDEINRKIEKAFNRIGIYDETGNNLLINTLLYCQHPL